MSVASQGDQPGPDAADAPSAARGHGWRALVRGLNRRTADGVPQPGSPERPLSVPGMHMAPESGGLTGRESPVDLDSSSWTGAALWRDPVQRRWLALGILALVLVLGSAVAAPRLRDRFALPAAPPAAEAPAPEAPAVEPPPAAPPAQPAPPEGQPPAQPEPEAPAGPVSPTLSQLGLAALPLLLGLFWLLSAWLVDAEARRAFVVQEPWGERRTVAYSCLAVGCVFPLILAGLLFAAWGLVSFVIYVANRQNWTAGIQAGALVLLVCAAFLLLRSLIVRWMVNRRTG